MFGMLFGKNETIEETIIKKPFNEKAVDKIFQKIDYDKNDSTLLHLCAKNDCFAGINYLLKKGVKVNSLNEKEENAIFSAIKSNAIESIKVLLKNGSNVNQKNIDGELPLHLVIKNALLQVIDLIANKTEELDYKNKAGRNILFYAIESKNRTVIKKVLSFLDEINVNLQDNKGNTICHLKELSSDISTIEDLLELGLDLNKKNKKGEDFLFLNCLDLDLDNDFFIFLIRHGVKLNELYDVTKTPLIMHLTKKLLSYDIQVYDNKSFINQYQERILTFIEHGADINAVNKDDENILFSIIRNNDDLNLDFFLNSTQINVNQKNIQGLTLLDIAIFNGKVNLDIIKRLLFTNIDSSIKDKNGHCVIEKVVDIILSESTVNRVKKIPHLRSYPGVNYAQILNLLLEYIKVDINKLSFDNEPIIFEIATSYNITLLDVFKKYGANLDILSPNDKLNVFYKVLQSGKNEKGQKQQFHKTLNYLILNNVNIDCKDSFGGNVIHKAILDHDLQVINLLTKRVGDYRAIDNKGRNYIHNTVWGDKIDILKKIALKNRDLINQADKFGILPINYAVIMGKKDVVFTLIKLGAFLNNQNKINEQFKESFFAKLGDLDDILNTSMTVNERALMTKLVHNMKEEFQVKSKK